MKSRLFPSMLVLVAALPASAAEVFKANNTTALSDSASWASGGPPGVADLAVWDAAVTATNSSALGASMTWGGIKVLEPGGAVTITATEGATLSLGASGIDLLSTLRNLTINAALAPVANQVWNVAASRSVTLAAQTGGAGVTITRTGDGTLNFNNITGSVFAANLVLNSGTTRFVNTNGSQTFSGAISGGGTLARTANGDGTVALSGNNLGFTGAFNITGSGPIHLGHANALGASTINITATGGARLDNITGAPLTLGAGASFVLGGNLTFLGSADIDLGAAPFTINGDRTITVSDGTVTTAGGFTATSGSLTKAGAGTLVAQPGGDFVLSGKLAVTAGTLRVSGGQLECGGSGTGNLELNGGTLELNGGSLTARAVTGAAGATLLLNGGTLLPWTNANPFVSGQANLEVGAAGAVIDTSGYAVVFAQPLLHDPLLGDTPDGGLRVNDEVGNGALTLSGANTYTGPTVIESGTLAIAAGGSIDSSPLIELQANGILDAGAGFTLASGQTLAGIGEVDGELTVGAGATLAPAGALPDKLWMNGTVTLNGTVEIQLQKINATLNYDAVLNLERVNYGGTLSVTHSGTALAKGDSFILFEALEYSGDFATIDLPQLAAGLLWDTSRLAIDGTITVSDSLPAPIITPPGGNYYFPPTVTITGLTGSTIRYTLDGSNPAISGTATTAPSPVTGIQVPDNPLPFMVRAYAFMPLITPSDETTASYQILGAATWIANADGDWQNAANWQGGTVPNGSGAPANFATLTLTGHRTVSLLEPATVGLLKFGDVGDAFGWTITGADEFTLSSNESSPTVEVANQSAVLATPLAGTQGLLKTGPGLLVLSGTNTYGGATAIDAGTLQLGDGTNQPTVNSTYEITDGATLRLLYNATNGSQPQTWSKFTGAGTLALASGKNFDYGWGQMTLPAEFTGQLIIERGRVENNSAGTAFGGAHLVSVRSGGHLALYNASAGSTVTANLEIAGTGYGEIEYPGALRLPDSSATLAGTITLTDDAAICGSWSGSAVGTITAAIAGPADADLSFVNPPWITTYTFVLSGANTYAGNTIVDRGVLRLGASEVIPNGPGKGILTVNSAATASVNLYGFNETINGLSGMGPVTSTLAGSVLSVGDADQSSTFGGALTGLLSLRKIGTGTLTLTGSSTHTGATTVDAGTLLVNGSLAAGSAVTANSGATLGGSGTAAGAVAIATGATLAPGADATTVGPLTTGPLTLAGTYQCQVSGATADRVTVNGDLVLTNSTLIVSALGATEAGTRVIASYSGTRTGAFGGTLPAGYSVSYDDTAMEVRLTVSAGGDPYGDWAASKGLTAANNGKTLDPDGDGVSNLLEFYLNGDPLAANSAILPKVVAMDATTVTFGWTRLDAAEPSVPVQNFQFGSTLTGWTNVPIGATGGPGPNGIVVNIAENDAAADSITVVIPRTLAAAGKLFGRLFLSE